MISGRERGIVNLGRGVKPGQGLGEHGGGMAQTRDMGTRPGAANGLDSVMLCSLDILPTLLTQCVQAQPGLDRVVLPGSYLRYPHLASHLDNLHRGLNAPCQDIPILIIFGIVCHEYRHLCKQQ
jgi:hypothetical protein